MGFASRMTILFLSMISCQGVAWKKFSMVLINFKFLVIPITCLAAILIPFPMFYLLLGKKENKDTLSWGERYKIAVGVAEALDYLHGGGSAQPVIHRDVKSSNILLSDDFDPQVSFFLLILNCFRVSRMYAWTATTFHAYILPLVGCFSWLILDLLCGHHHLHHTWHSMMLQERSGLLSCYFPMYFKSMWDLFSWSNCPFYVRYLAPEYLVHGKVNEKIDVYAFGVVLLELLSGRKPISSQCPKGEESLVMWVSSISKFLDHSLKLMTARR